MEAHFVPEQHKTDGESRHLLLLRPHSKGEFKGTNPENG